jgi:hypothetical protein
MGNPLMQAIMAMHDLTAGKYDLTVNDRPELHVAREEAVDSMTEMVQAYPAAAPVIIPDPGQASSTWPGADKIAEKMEEMASGQVPPQAQQQMEDRARSRTSRWPGAIAAAPARKTSS